MVDVRYGPELHVCCVCVFGESREEVMLNFAGQVS